MKKIPAFLFSALLGSVLATTGAHATEERVTSPDGALKAITKAVSKKHDDTLENAFGNHRFVRGYYRELRLKLKESVYLPVAGAPWYNFWTGATSPAGKGVDAVALVETVPLFVKPGSIIPMSPFLQYSSEKPADPIELRIYRGADGKFTLYEDEHDTCNYEKGKFATIPIAWSDAKHTLGIGKRTGEFPGMLKERTFNIVLVSENHGAGVPVTEKPDAVVHYLGKAMKVSVP